MSEWIEWKGGECPVAAGTRVQVRFGRGETSRAVTAGRLDWAAGEDVYPIIAYRVVEEAVQPAPNTKPTNPKDAIGDTKLPLALLSPIAKAHWALAQHCGRVKYGAWNWREAGVRASVYISAIGRHMDGYLSGEQLDPADGTHHLGNVMACCAILLEAEARGNLTDDRPPRLDMRPAYALAEQVQATLTEKYADRNPKHWTIADTLQPAADEH